MLSNKSIRSKFCLLFSLFFLLSSNYCQIIAQEEIIKLEHLQLFKEVEKKEKEKTSFTFQFNDLKTTFGGATGLEYYHDENLSYFNKKLPNEFAYVKYTMDILTNIIYGEKKYHHKAIETYLNLRNRGLWGITGTYLRTSKTNINLDNISLGEHYHNDSLNLAWFREAWINFSINAALGLKTKNLHFIKIGLFPFQLGKGIALGPYYETYFEETTTKTTVGDPGSPGINISGEIIKNILSYDLYYTKFEDNSALFSDTFNTVKSNHVGHINTPWRGVAKDDELWAARLKYYPFQEKKFGKLLLEPYIYYNEASDQKIEVRNDCKSKFGSYGINLEYKKCGIECGIEVATNYGSDNLYEIDRNTVIIQTINNSSETIPSNLDGTGNSYEAYSHVLINNPGNAYDGKPAPINDLVTQAAEKYQTYTPNVAYPDDPVGAKNLKNAPNRIRPSYKNDLDGYFGLLDLSYNFSKHHFEIATEMGLATGDFDPNKIETNKKNHNFLGLHEYYYGRKVTSMVFWGERESIIPMPLEPNKKESDGYYATMNNVAFTDIRFVGFSVKWSPSKLKLHPNILFFWKDSMSSKYLLDINNPKNGHTSDENDKARKFLGTEINLIVTFEPFKDFKILGSAGTFIPGGFLEDVKGVPGKDDLFKSLGYPNNYNVLDYRIGSDAAYYLASIITYDF